MTPANYDLRRSLPDRICHPNYTATKVAESRLYTSDKYRNNKTVGALIGFYRADGQSDHELENLSEIFSKKRPLTVAVDAEWFQRVGAIKPSVLFYRSSIRSGSGVRYDAVVVFTRDVRFAPGTLLGAVVDFVLTLLPSQSELVTSGKGKVALYITLLGHYGIVDFSTFYRKNSQSGLMKQTEGVRRTLVTFDPVNIKAFDSNRNEKYTLKTQLRDTMLLAPAGAQSLANSAQL